jgi:hypothetical protein
MPKPIQFKKLLLLMLVFSSSTNVLSRPTSTIRDAEVRRHIKDQWKDTRYSDNGDGTVTDTKTALMWKQCHEGFSGSLCTVGSREVYNWADAIEHANNHNFAEHSDWRLPNIKELNSLVARDQRNPAINEKRFPSTGNSLRSTTSRYYSVWSSSLAMQNISTDGNPSNGYHFVLDFSFGKVGIDNGGSYVMRLVRDVK